MKKILVGYDGSDSARSATVEAAQLARATSAELHVIGVVNDDRVREGMTTTSDQDAAEAAAVKIIGELLSTGERGLGDLLDGVANFAHIVSGSPAGRILEHASTIDADLIVIGNRQVQGLERILGSVAITILRRAQCSVYVAHTS